MTQELQKQEQQIGELTQEHIDTLTKAGVIPKNTPEPQVKLFAEICREKKLSPFSRQIHLVKRYDKNNGETYTAQTGIDGYRAIANRTGQYAGSDEPLYDEGLTAFQMEDKGRKQPRTATVTVYKLVSGQRIPFTSTVRWAEFYPGEKMGFMWKKMPFSQLAKCSESQALRKAFPEEIGGVYTEEEMQQAEAGANQEQKEKTEENLKAVVQDAQQSEDVEQAEQSDEPDNDLTSGKSKMAYQVALQKLKDCQTLDELEGNVKTIADEATQQGLNDTDRKELNKQYKAIKEQLTNGEQESSESQSTEQSGQDQS